MGSLDKQFQQQVIEQKRTARLQYVTEKLAAAAEGDNEKVTLRFNQNPVKNVITNCTANARTWGDITTKPRSR